jgi:integrase/recombinase XerD
MKKTFTSCLGGSIDRYLKLKEALGRRFAIERRVLEQLDDFMIEAAAEDLSQVEFDDWCRTQRHISSGVRRNRMRIVRNFCLYRQRTCPNIFIPNADLFPTRHQAIRPYVFSDRDIMQLLRTCTMLSPTPWSPLRPQVYRLAVVLLYTTGLRRGELIRLTLHDYDSRTRTLHVRESKFHRSRYVPLSADAAQEIQHYLAARRTLRLPMKADAPLLFSGNAQERPYSGEGLWHGMHVLMKTAGVRKADGQVPRVHDYRHGFAICVLLRFYRAGVDLQAKLPLLATYMGHISIASTEYYLSFLPEIATAASDRFCARYGTLVQEAPEGDHHA